jgi:hypothetical protein
LRRAKITGNELLSNFFKKIKVKNKLAGIKGFILLDLTRLFILDIPGNISPVLIKVINYR